MHAFYTLGIEDCEQYSWVRRWSESVKGWMQCKQAHDLESLLLQSFNLFGSIKWSISNHFPTAFDMLALQPHFLLPAFCQRSIRAATDPNTML